MSKETSLPRPRLSYLQPITDGEFSHGMHAMDADGLPGMMLGHSGTALLSFYSRDVPNSSNPLTPREIGLMEKLEPHVTNTFEKRLARAFHLPPDRINGLSFFERQLLHARTALSYLQSRLFPPELNHNTDLLNEITLKHPPIDTVLNDLRTSKSDPLLRYQRQREITMAYIAAQLDIRTTEANLSDELHDIHELLNKKLYTGLRGETTNIRMYATHKDNTNEAIALYDEYPSPDMLPIGTHVKTHTQKMRHIDHLGYVRPEIREKPIHLALLKVLRETVKRNGNDNKNEVCDPYVDVQDTMGLKFVVKGGSEEADAVLTRVIDIIQQHKGERLEYIQDKDVTGDKYQSSHVKFRRKIVKLKDLPVPFEIITESALASINNEFYIGTYNENTRNFTGPAHTLYEISRLKDLLPYVYPPHLYPDLDLEAIAEMALYTEAKRLQSFTGVAQTRRYSTNT